jgi:hypothetical protein
VFGRTAPNTRRRLSIHLKVPGHRAPLRNSPTGPVRASKPAQHSRARDFPNYGSRCSIDAYGACKACSRPTPWLSTWPENRIPTRLVAADNGHQRAEQSRLPSYSGTSTFSYICRRGNALKQAFGNNSCRPLKQTRSRRRNFDPVYRVTGPGGGVIRESAARTPPAAPATRER